MKLSDCKDWWAGRDSNPQPDRYERPALTVELPAPAGLDRNRFVAWAMDTNHGASRILALQSESNYSRRSQRSSTATAGMRPRKRELHLFSVARQWPR